MRDNNIEKITKQLLEELGENPEREGLLKTPAGVFNKPSLSGFSPSSSKSCFVIFSILLSLISVLLIVCYFNLTP